MTKVENTGSKLENEYIEDINNKTDNAVNEGVPASNNLEDRSHVLFDNVELLIQRQYRIKMCLGPWFEKE